MTTKENALVIYTKETSISILMEIVVWVLLAADKLWKFIIGKEN